MASVNKVIVLGNLGRDPELRHTPSGTSVCNLAIATSRSWKNKETGEKMEETEWHRVVFYDRLAEVADEYLEKGRPVYVEGRLKTRKWQDKDGADRYTTEIVGEHMQLLGGRDREGGGERDGGGDSPQHDGRGRPSAAPARAPAPAPRGRAAAPAPAARSKGGSTGFDDMNDDIPFITSSFEYDTRPRSVRKMARYDY